MSINERIIAILVSGFFFMFGTWPFSGAVHGDGSFTTGVDYFFHIAGGFVFFFLVIKALIDLYHEEF